MTTTLDYPRMRAALVSLDALRLAHPEAFEGRTEDDWIETLSQDENEMNTPKRRFDGQDSFQVAARLPRDQVDKLDAYAREHSTPGLTLTRSDALRLLLARGLDAVGRCCSVHGEHVCTLHLRHKGTHYDSHTDTSWEQHYEP